MYKKSLWGPFLFGLSVFFVVSLNTSAMNPENTVSSSHDETLPSPVTIPESLRLIIEHDNLSSNAEKESTKQKLQELLHSTYTDSNEETLERLLKALQKLDNVHVIDRHIQKFIRCSPEQKQDVLTALEIFENPVLSGEEYPSIPASFSLLLDTLYDLPLRESLSDTEKIEDVKKHLATSQHLDDPPDRIHFLKAFFNAPQANLDELI